MHNVTYRSTTTEIRYRGHFILRNFRTHMDIRPGVTYRLSVKRLHDGAHRSR